MFIGKQKIIKEKKLDDNFVEVTLESTLEAVLGSDGTIEHVTAEGLGKTEKVVFNTIILELVKTEEEEMDLTSFRQKRTLPIISGILDVMAKYNMHTDDFETVFMGVKSSIEHAETIKRRKESGVHDNNETLHRFQDELPT